MGNYIRKSSEERIKEIQVAALELFLEKGFSEITMKDVIDATSMSKGGVYHYYKNTQDIFADLIRLKNYNYLGKMVDADACETVEEACDMLSRAFVKRMNSSSTMNHLHLMMAEGFANSKEFLELYYTVENEPVGYINKILSKFCSEEELEKSQKKLMLLYRINNTLHFVKHLYLDKDPEAWGVDDETLYELCFNMLWDIAAQGKEKPDIRY